MHLSDAIAAVRDCWRQAPITLDREPIIFGEAATLLPRARLDGGSGGYLALTETRLLFRQFAPFSRLLHLDQSDAEILLDVIIALSAPRVPARSAECGEWLDIRMLCGDVERFRVTNTRDWVRAIETAAGRRLWVAAGIRSAPDRGLHLLPPSSSARV